METRESRGLSGVMGRRGGREQTDRQIGFHGDSECGGSYFPIRVLADDLPPPFLLPGSLVVSGQRS